MIEKRELGQMILKLKRMQYLVPNVNGLEDVISFLEKIYCRNILVIDSKKIEKHLDFRTTHFESDIVRDCNKYSVDLHLRMEKQIPFREILKMTNEEQVKFEKELIEKMKFEFCYSFEDMLGADLKEDTSND